MIILELPWGSRRLGPLVGLGAMIPKRDAEAYVELAISDTEISPRAGREGLEGRGGAGTAHSAFKPVLVSGERVIREVRPSDVGVPLANFPEGRSEMIQVCGSASPAPGWPAIGERAEPVFVQVVDPRRSVLELVVVARLMDLHVEVAHDDRVGARCMAPDQLEYLWPRVRWEVNSTDGSRRIGSPRNLDGDFNGAPVDLHKWIQAVEQNPNK